MFLPHQQRNNVLPWSSVANGRDPVLLMLNDVTIRPCEPEYAKQRLTNRMVYEETARIASTTPLTILYGTGDNTVMAAIRQHITPRS